MDPRTKQLAKLLVDYSVFVKPNEKVIISGGIEAQDFITVLYKEVILKGAHPILRVNLPGLTPFFYKYAKKHQIERFESMCWLRLIQILCAMSWFGSP